MGFRSETALEAAIFRTSLAELRYGKGAVASEPIDLRDLQENGTFLSFSQVCPETIVLYYVKMDQKYRFLTWFASAAIFQCAGYRSIEKARAGRQHAACAAMCMVKVCTVSAEILRVSRCQANPAAAPAENAFLLDCPKFVPSLSWQNNRSIHKWLQKGVFRTAAASSAARSPSLVVADPLQDRVSPRQARVSWVHDNRKPSVGLVMQHRDDGSDDHVGATAAAAIYNAVVVLAGPESRVAVRRLERIRPGPCVSTNNVVLFPCSSGSSRACLGK